MMLKSATGMTRLHRSFVKIFGVTDVNCSSANTVEHQLLPL